MNRFSKVMVFIGCVCGLIFVGAATAQSKLDKIHTQILKKYPAVNHLDAVIYNQLDPLERVVFDVREENEFAVSHLENAIHIDPDMDPDVFLAKYGEMIQGKSAIFYCSVGRRSSSMASQILSAMDDSAKFFVFNLEGGIFKWRNENRSLVQAESSTSYVHPYNAWWSRLIENKKAIRYKP